MPTGTTRAGTVRTTTMDGGSASRRVSSLLAVAMFVVGTVFSLAGMSIYPGIYDEGITVTDAMRVMAGQLPHRDFYAIYGPAHFYLVAGVFKVFGESLLVERVLYGVISGLLVAAVYVVASRQCRRGVAVCASVAMLLWLFALDSVSGAAIFPASLLSMMGVTMLLPVFWRRLSVRRALAVGVAAGATALFRYDTGVGLLGVESCAIGFALLAQVETFRVRSVLGWVRSLVGTLWPCYAGFALVVGPVALYYVSQAKIHDFLYDIVIYPHKYYHRARNLPFPGVHAGALTNLILYLPLIVIVVALSLGISGSLRRRRPAETLSGDERERLRWCGFLVSFGILSLTMYMKGLVRTSPLHMYLSIQPGILLVAVLLQRWRAERRLVSVAILGVTALSLLMTWIAARNEVKFLRTYHRSVLSELVHGRGSLSPLQQAWCATRSPLTRGFCFLPDDDRIRTMEFVDAHTTSKQRLFVGVTHHDKIYANDMMMYFATQRMPATHWSHFDPLLQTRADTQRIMIAELQAGPPPYLVEDAEFDFMNEPNESSISTGVTLLDDYIYSHYSVVETYGVFTIWQRRPGF